jgi:hypothetical protein
VREKIYIIITTIGEKHKRKENKLIQTVNQTYFQYTQIQKAVLIKNINLEESIQPFQDQEFL